MGQIVAALAGLSCADVCAGGVKNIWLANSGDIDTVTYDGDGQVNAITMVTNKVFYAAVFKRQSKEFTEAIAFNPDTCGNLVTQSLSGVISCCDDDARIWLQNAAKQSCCGIAVIHEEAAGCVKVWGLDTEYPAYLLSTDRKTGKKLEDANETVVTFECKTTLDNMAVEFTGSVPD